SCLRLSPVVKMTQQLQEGVTQLNEKALMEFHFASVPYLIQDFLTSTGQGYKSLRVRPSLTEDRAGASRLWPVCRGGRWASLYSNWDSKDLHDNGTAPACVKMVYHGHWSDFSCESESPVFICEKWQSC
ncbi:hypothetical protein Cadr_000025558, partial [Camelus dromedarius]